MLGHRNYATYLRTTKQRSFVHAPQRVHVPSAIVVLDTLLTQ